MSPRVGNVLANEIKALEAGGRHVVAAGEAALGQDSYCAIWNADATARWQAGPMGYFRPVAGATLGDLMLPATFRGRNISSITSSTIVEGQGPLVVQREAWRFDGR